MFVYLFVRLCGYAIFMHCINMAYMKQIISFLLLVILSINICNAQENCTNGIDDDGDGLIDCVDPDCESCFANNPVYACNDLIYYYLPPTWQFNGSTPQDIFLSTQFPNAAIHIQTINGSFSLDTSAQFGSPAIIQLPQGIVAAPNFNTVETNRGLLLLLMFRFNVFIDYYQIIIKTL